MSCPANLDTLLVVWAKWQWVSQGPEANWVSALRGKQREESVHTQQSDCCRERERERKIVLFHFIFSIHFSLMRWQTACGENWGLEWEQSRHVKSLFPRNPASSVLMKLGALSKEMCYNQLAEIWHSRIPHVEIKLGQAASIYGLSHYYDVQ